MQNALHFAAVLHFALRRRDDPYPVPNVSADICRHIDWGAGHGWVGRDDDVDTVDRALCAVTDGYYAMFQAEPVMRDIWSGVQADKDLQALDEADLQAHGATLASALAAVQPNLPGAERDRLALVMMNMICATVRLAITRDTTEAAALVETFKQRFLVDAITV